jgi:putative membrane protein
MEASMVTRKLPFWEAGILFTLLQPWSAMAQSQPGWDWPGPWHMWAGGWGFWWIFPLLMFGLMVFLCALFMFRGPWSHREHRDATTPALTVLNERFAKGDISKEEFEEKRAILVRPA